METWGDIDDSAGTADRRRYRNLAAAAVPQRRSNYRALHAASRPVPQPARLFLGQANTTAWGQVKSDSQDDENGDDDVDEDLLAQLDEATLEELRMLETDDSEGFKDPWTRVRDQELPFYEFWGAYRDNLVWVLNDVQRLLNNCDGRIVLTSDHGNGIGVWDVWSHPPGVAIPAVRRVPWVPLEGRDLRTHRPGVPNHVVGSSVRDDAVEARLADLGYR